MMHRRAGRPLPLSIHPARSNHFTLLFLFGFLLLAAGLLQSGGVVLAGDEAESWCAVSGQGAVPDAECRALEELYYSTQGDAWRDNDGWLDSTAVCRDWTGVSCSGGQVSSLTLAANKLSGPLPDAIGELSALTQLDLTGNQINGAIPPALGRLAALTDLSLGGNLLEGSIPPELGQLSLLAALDLGNNRLSGSIPARLGALENLTGMLYLDGNQLEGPIPTAVCNLQPLLASASYNKLDIYGTADECDAAFTQWRATQTTAPVSITVSNSDVQSVQGTTAVSSDVLLQWLPAPYTGSGGGYEVLTRHRASGEIQSRGRTADKTADSLQFVLEGDPKAYAYFLRAHSDAHAANQSPLTSADSDAVVITAVNQRALDIAPKLPIIYYAAAAPLALLFIIAVAALTLK